MTKVVELMDRTGLAFAPDARARQSASPILAAVDLGEGSRAAVLWASELAEKTGSSLKILHVIHDPADRHHQQRRDKQQRRALFEDLVFFENCHIDYSLLGWDSCVG